MLCEKFRCVYLADGECEPMGTECIGDMREEYGQCSGCQQQDKEECEGCKSL